MRIWKAFRVDGRATPPVPDYPAEAILLDGPASATFDWSLAAHFTRPLILAGGLDARQRRATRSQQAEPWGVDVAPASKRRPAARITRA